MNGKRLLVLDISSSPSASIVIAQYLKDAITNGVLADNEALRQDQIAAMFNVSKIPVREALKSLEAEGFVVFNKNRGAFVSSVSEAELSELTEIRAILESSITKLAVPKMTRRNFNELEVWCEKFSQEDNPQKWSGNNWNLHASIYEAAGKPQMLKMIKTVHDQMERYIRVQLSINESRVTADAEHRQLLSLCLDRDAEGASALIYQHIMTVSSDLISRKTI